MLRIYIDMDHTFFDMAKGAAAWREFAITDVEQTWPWSMTGLFKYLPPIEGAMEFFKQFEDRCELWFLTRPSINNIACYTEKAESIQRHFGTKMLERLILCPQKDLLIGDILIDDSGKYGQETSKGQWWQFGEKDNENWKVITDKLEKILANESIV